jgi:hypothetical protein
MSTKTKKINVDPNSKRITDELETTTDLYRSLAEYERQLKEEEERKKNRVAEQIYSIGDEMVDDIKQKQLV